MASNDICDWYHSIPKITKWWFTGSVFILIAATLGVLNPMWLFLHYESFIYRFQVKFYLQGIAFKQDITSHQQNYVSRQFGTWTIWY